jgi:predicted anti-sigma-YlaC factor YlaD
MVIDCKHVWNYISEYLDGALPEETRDTVQKHLDHCEICSAILDSTRNVIILTADDRVFELPRWFQRTASRPHRSRVHGSVKNGGILRATRL